MKPYGGVDVQIHIFLISALAGGKWSASRPGSFSPLPGTQWIEGRMAPGGDIDYLEERKLTLPRLELRPLSRPARSQSLYWLRYSSSSILCIRDTYSVRIGRRRFNDVLHVEINVEKNQMRMSAIVILLPTCVRHAMCDIKCVMNSQNFSSVGAQPWIVIRSRSWNTFPNLTFK
jgi:hypothetical protein